MTKTEREVRRCVKNTPGASIDPSNKPERGFILVVERADGATMPISSRTNITELQRWLRR